ncbi:hypothetical protein K474DRAFT_1708784 [Panus rudis PR-1116 ss-1]|nr:hypothetical protein K474DRAFT_1708784 [Panus rudis PR-1116 ss-1]
MVQFYDLPIANKDELANARFVVAGSDREGKPLTVEYPPGSTMGQSPIAYIALYGLHTIHVSNSAVHHLEVPLRARRGLPVNPINSAPILQSFIPTPLPQPTMSTNQGSSQSPLPTTSSAEKREATEPPAEDNTPTSSAEKRKATEPPAEDNIPTTSGSSSFPETSVRRSTRARVAPHQGMPRLVSQPPERKRTSPKKRVASTPKPQLPKVQPPQPQLLQATSSSGPLSGPVTLYDLCNAEPRRPSPVIAFRTEDHTRRTNFNYLYNANNMRVDHDFLGFHGYKTDSDEDLTVGDEPKDDEGSADCF